jgi:hypothetical protein
MLEILQTMEPLSLYWFFVFCSRSLRESTTTLGTFEMKQILNAPCIWKHWVGAVSNIPYLRVHLGRNGFSVSHTLWDIGEEWILMYHTLRFQKGTNFKYVLP